MAPFIWLINNICNLIFWLILASVIISWLMQFGIVDGRNHYVKQINYALARLTEPLLAPIRRFMPDLGGIDLSPVVLLLGIEFFRQLVVSQLYRMSIPA
jgi:YggT family protein